MNLEFWKTEPVFISTDSLIRFKRWQESRFRARVVSPKTLLVTGGRHHHACVFAVIRADDSRGFKAADSADTPAKMITAAWSLEGTSGQPWIFDTLILVIGQTPEFRGRLSAPPSLPVAYMSPIRDLSSKDIIILCLYLFFRRCIACLCILYFDFVCIMYCLFGHLPPVIFQRMVHMSD